MAPETAPSGKPVSREPTGSLVPLSGSGSGLLSMVSLPRSEVSGAGAPSLVSAVWSGWG